MSIEQGSATAAHWQEEQYRAALESDSGPERVALVIEDAKVVGFIVALVLGEEWEIENVVVGEGERRHGIGSRLLKEVMDLAKIRSAHSVFLEVRESNHAAQQLYRKWGFSPSGRRKGYYAEPAEDALQFRYNFPQQRAKAVEGPGGVC